MKKPRRKIPSVPPEDREKLQLGVDKYTEPTHYKNYVGAYGKRFYASYTKETIRKIDGFSDTRRNFAEFHFEGDPDDYWYDCEDTCIITNELPIKEIDWVSNINDPRYVPEYYNPYV